MGKDKWDISREELLEALKKSNWSIDQAAQKFGMPRTTFQNRLDRDWETIA